MTSQTNEGTSPLTAETAPSANPATQAPLSVAGAPTSQLQYTVCSRAWYGPANLKDRSDRVVDYLSFGDYTPDGGCFWEASIELVQHDHNSFGVNLTVWHDGWQALAQYPALFAGLATLAGTLPPSWAAIETIFQQNGFVDATPTKDPYNA